MPVETAKAVGHNSVDEGSKLSCPSRWEEAGEVGCRLKAAVAEHEVGTLVRETARRSLRGNVGDGLDEIGDLATVLGEKRLDEFR